MQTVNENGDHPQEHKYFHCSDCDLTVHENDRENHLNGGRHKYRIRTKSDSSKPEPQFQCGVCATEFTDDHFYTIHQGSKTHKRNLKRLRRLKSRKKGLPDFNGDECSTESRLPPEIRPIRRSVPITKETEPSSIIRDLGDICDYKSVREKYRPRNTKNPEGNNKLYICSVTAYWAVNLALEPNVKDFKISLNDKEWGDFGDAVVQIEFQETKDKPSFSTTFAIQFKDITNNVKSIDSFGEGRFGLAKYLSQVNTVKLCKDVENKKYVVYTTALADANMDRQLKLRNDIIHMTKQDCDCRGEEKEISVVAKTLSNRRKLLINTSEDNDNIFFFFCTDNVHNLPTIYLYTHQKKQKHFGVWIDEMISSSLYGARVDIHREFIKYIEYWGDGHLGGNYKLKKEDVLVKLGHLLLYRFKIPPVAKATEKHNYGIWKHAVNSVDVTILRKHSLITSKVCEPLNQKIETELGVKIDITTSSVDLDQNLISNIQNPVLKMYLFEETTGEIQDDIPLDLVYDFFWKAGLLPLLLQVENAKDQEHILNVVTLLKSLGLTRRYLLMAPDQHIRSSLRYYRTLAFFVRVDDIVHKILPFLLDYVKIRVSESYSLSLKDIQESDKFFLKTVSAHEFFDMSLDKCSFKSFNNHLATKEGQDAPLVLRDELMAKLREEIELKDEMKMVLPKYESDVSKQYLRGVRPNLFS